MRSISLPDAAVLLKCKGEFSSSPIKGFCTDSQLIKPGELFFALKGNRVNGHDFLCEIKEKGALAAVVSQEERVNIEGLCLLHVENPLDALQKLAKEMLERSKSRVVGITGSVGKTSTKEFVNALLQSKYHLAASPGNHNSQVGLPLSILNHTQGDEEIIVLEMGMNGAGQLERLVQIAPPEVALITTVALVHASFFDSLESIARAKAEIFSHPATKLGILHRDILNFSEICLQGPCPKISFSTTTPEADYYLDIRQKEKKIFSSQHEITGLETLSLPGKHNLHNLLGAIAIARYFKMEWEEINAIIPTLTLPERRLQFVHHQGILFVNDSYNAAEISIKSALESLPGPENGGRKIAVLGGIAELGDFSEGCHRRLGEFAVNHVEKLYCLGEECLPAVQVWEKKRLSVNFFTDRRDLTETLRKELRAGDVVLLKGSKSKELWKVVEEF